MALPHLVKYIYNNGTDEVIRRGKKIFAQGSVELIDHDALFGAVTFRVKDDGYSTYYKVYINKYKDAKAMNLRCGCPYNLGEICRHEAAALFQLQEMVDRNMLSDEGSDIYYDQKHTVLKMKLLDLKLIRLLSNPSALNAAQDYLRSNKATIVEAKDEKVLCEVDYNGVVFPVLIQKNEERNFDTSCNCNTESRHPLCVHKVIVLLQLLNSFGPSYFDTIRNLDKEKNKLLSLYGYSLSDNLEGKFEFTIKEGKPFLKVLDPSIKRITAFPDISPRPIAVAPAPPVAEQKPKAHIRLGLVISYNAHQYPYIQFDVVQGETDDAEENFTGKVERLDVAKYVNLDVLNEDDKAILQQVRKLLPGEVSRYLNRNSPFSGIWENIIQQHDDELPEETRHLIAEYLQPKIRKILNEAAQSNFVFFLPSGKTFTTANLQRISASDTLLQPAFTVQLQKDAYELECTAKTEQGFFSIADNEISSSILFLKDNVAYTWEKSENVLLVEKFLPSGKIIYNEQEWEKQLTEYVLPLSKDYKIDFGNLKKEELRDIQPEYRIFLKERNDYLIFQPVFTYLDYIVQAEDGDKIVIPKADKLLIIYRNEEKENKLLLQLENLHSNFRKLDDGSYALKGADVLKNNWFFLFVDAVKEQNIPVFGFEALKNFRFNTAKPQTKIFISSHTDWFDAKVDIQFGEQKVTVADVKKALANKQQYVQLGDGSLGILPEEWLKKYSLLFKIGEGKASNIKLNKYQFSVIEQLYEERDEEELFFKLEEKYERLKEIHGIPELPAPSHLAPILRPYQLSGFQWLNYLNEVHWGGILADDMGLGKTIQALSFLQHLKQQHGTLKALVVCPTTLMYNWENEIKKFVPGLKHYIHHGGQRVKSELSMNDVDVMITTYGTLRSDIKQFVEIPFDYVVLDESQAIKNPSSKVTKAASLLKAKNRLCMSGTPLQNNTFDLFAQMNFLNPGMLGSMEFFKQEFAIPIDKFGEKEQKEHLRKLLYPFILRRTKEQVAKDLPEKSEMILFCEMGKEQRNIYDAYRNDYRDKILGVVEEQGVQKSQLTILQGLMKLRQICDSPAIIKEEEKYPNVSVKLEELGREITENISNHKALVFSQFLGMLALIKEKLHELGVNYEYFDGSTSPQERERAIQRFQNDEDCRVFLISLKAGGVGLNLTAADYVYIVDPWWNPAVEQQAIDRTHRIGQTKNIFAYRMICKDTVEDKILQLQERKKALAADLVTDDAGFVKTLTREDIEYLFS